MNEDINEDINLKIMKLSNARSELHEELEHHEEGSAILKLELQP